MKRNVGPESPFRTVGTHEHTTWRTPQTPAPSAELIFCGSPHTISSAPARSRATDSARAALSSMSPLAATMTTGREAQRSTDAAWAKKTSSPASCWAQYEVSPKESSCVAQGWFPPVVRTRMSPGARPESRSRSTASSAASSAPPAGAGISWSCAAERFSGRLRSAGAGAGTGAEAEAGAAGRVDVGSGRCAGGAGRAGPGPGCPGRGVAAERGPGTGRGVGAVRPAAGVTRGPWTLSGI